MTKLSLRPWSPRLSVARVLALALIALPLVAGCDASGPDPNTPAPVAGGPGPGPGGGGGPGGNSRIRQIMARLGRGPNSLTPTLGKELKLDPPPWDTIGGEAQEYARLTDEMGPLDPPKGSKESWTALTADYAEAAAALNTAAKARDKAAALSAHDRLGNSCNACHREHRPGPPGGGRGGPPGGFPGGPPPGGPPPGGFPGGPPPEGAPPK